MNCKVNAKSLILDIICTNFLQPIHNTCITCGIDYMNTVYGRIILCEVVFFFFKENYYLLMMKQRARELGSRGKTRDVVV